MAGVQGGSSGSSMPPSDVSAPANVNVAVWILSSIQVPFGANCLVDHHIWFFSFHYGVSAPIVQRVDKEEFHTVTEVLVLVCPIPVFAVCLLSAIPAG